MKLNLGEVIGMVVGAIGAGILVGLWIATLL